jgi:hypothetical protein
MMRKTISLLVLLMMAAGTAVFAQEVQRTVTVLELKGKVDVKADGAAWSAVKAGDVIRPKDVIKTGRKSFAVLRLEGEVETATVRVQENSQLLIAELSENKEAGTQNTLLDLALGNILIKAQKLHAEKSKFEVKTPTSIVGVRGTTFSVSVEAVE